MLLRPRTDTVNYFNLLLVDRVSSQGYYERPAGVEYKRAMRVWVSTWSHACRGWWEEVGNLCTSGNRAYPPASKVFCKISLTTTASIMFQNGAALTRACGDGGYRLKAWPGRLIWVG